MRASPCRAGAENGRTGLALGRGEPPAFVLWRDKLPADVTSAVIEHCERLRDRFAVLTAEGGMHQAGALGVVRDTAYAATYYPCVRVPDASTASPLAPPHGHVLGIYARSDAEHGVHAAPHDRHVRGLAADALSSLPPHSRRCSPSGRSM
jgi:phage tail sheath protein FI